MYGLMIIFNAFGCKDIFDKVVSVSRSYSFNEAFFCVGSNCKSYLLIQDLRDFIDTERRLFEDLDEKKLWSTGKNLKTLSA